jgi:hypothetical protein
MRDAPKVMAMGMAMAMAMATPVMDMPGPIATGPIRMKNKRE